MEEETKVEYERKFDVSNVNPTRSNSPSDDNKPKSTAKSEWFSPPISAVSSARMSETRKISRFFKNLNPAEINVIRKA